VSSATCAAPGCDRPIPPRRPGAIGRPPIYCSVGCRPSARNHARFHVDIDHDDTDATSGPQWNVRLRRGRRTVTVATGLGRLTASALASELRRFLTPQEEGGDTIE
jgi:hypothetical protein